MLSKQEKQKYGEILRQQVTHSISQMKEKQQRKKIEDFEKRGHLKSFQPPKEPSQPTYKPTPFEKQNSYQRPLLDPKEQLQKKLQNQDYNYFGGHGGGAPNRKIPDQYNNNLRNLSQPNNLRLGPEQMMQYSGNAKQYQNEYQNQPQQRVRTVSQQDQFYQGQGMHNAMESISPQSINYARPNEGGYYQEAVSGQGQMGKNPNPYQLQQPPQNYAQYNNGYASNRQQQRQPISYELIPQNTRHQNSRLQENFPQNQYQMGQNYSQSNQMQPFTQLKPATFQMPPVQNQQMQYQMMEDTANQQLQEVYKKGGRNLLKLENQTIDEHMIKQKRKMQIQKQLKQQIQQAERRKKQEKEKLKREEEEQERKHLAYLAQQKRKVQEEQRKAKQAQQRVHQENRRNQQLRIKMQEQAKRKVQQQKANKQKVNNQNLRLQEQQKRQHQQLEKQKLQKPSHNSYQNSRAIVKPSPRITQDDNSSVISSETSELQKGFNTAMSKQFFRKQRERKNPSISQNHQMQKVTQEIKKMNYEIIQQRKQFTKVINQRQVAQIQKRKAMQQVESLKMQLKKKMNDDNQKLLRALQGDYKNNDFDRLPQQNYKNLNENQHNSQDYENQYPSFSKKPMRQRQHEQLVEKQYEPKPAKYIPKEQESNRFEQSNVGLMSLDGQSKKIPLFLEHSDKLTMSQVQDFAKDSAFFQKGSNNRLNGQSPAKQKFNTRINESIAEEADEDRDYFNNKSRESNRNKQTKKESSLYRNQQDELDKMIDSRAKSRGGWGEMSSVNSDITKEIDELLKKKQNGMGSNNGRPSSISNAGKQSLSKQGYAYDGLTLSNYDDNLDSNVGGTLGTNGTLDLERINGRNEARLRELKNLGVQTINTNGDDELDNLDRLLNKYKGN